MKNKILTIFMFAFFVGSVFASNPSYEASTAVLDSIIGPENSLVVYGFITHITGEEFSSTSDLKILYYSATSGPEYATTISHSSIQYVSDYENSDSVIIDGAFLANINVPSGLSDSETYLVDVMINDQVIGSTQFTYNSSKRMNSSLTIPSSHPYNRAGTFNAAVTLKDENIFGSSYDYIIGVIIPTINDLDREETSFSELNLPAGNSSTELIGFSSTSLRQGANFIISKVTSAKKNGFTAELPDLKNSFIKIFQTNQKSLDTDYSAALSMENCDIKEGTQSNCEFEVTNLGSYPTIFNVVADSELSTSVSFTNNLIQPGQTVSGSITINAEKGDAPTKELVLMVKKGSTIIDSLTKVLDIEDRNLHSVDLDVDSEVMIMDNDVLHLKLNITNTGDFEEIYKIKYSFGGESKIISTPIILVPGMSAIKNIAIDMKLVENKDLDNYNLVSIIITNADGEKMMEFGKQILIKKTSFIPKLAWERQTKYLTQGDQISNNLTIKNDGNGQDTFTIKIENSGFASLNMVKNLEAGEQLTINVPIFAALDAKVGNNIITAEMCSISSEECEKVSFSLKVSELMKYDSDVIINKTVETMTSSEQGAVFNLTIKNNEDSAKNYKLVITNEDLFEDLQITPIEQLVMVGDSAEFLIYALPKDSSVGQVEYEIIKGTEVFNSGNLTINYPNSLMSGFFTLSKAGSVGAIILGIGLLIGLSLLGVKIFNQSKIELKYWK